MASALLKLGLDDFVLPAQSCVNPLFLSSEVGGVANSLAGSARVSLEPDFLHPEGALATPSLPPRPAARVTLNDCLACSGCVTSAEAVLVAQQSTGELARALRTAIAAKSGGEIACVVVSIAPQALAALAAHYRIASTADCFKRLSTYLHSLGVDAVIDTQVALDLALCAEGDELLERLGASFERENPRLAWSAPSVTLPASATHVTRVLSTGVTIIDAASPLSTLPCAPEGSCLLPMLSSACPGWVCFAEKTVPESVPMLSRVRSPQQLTGLLTKLLIASGQARLNSRCSMVSGERLLQPPLHTIYHCAIMPCYDKKLEGSRRDFFWERDSMLSSIVGSASSSKGSVSIADVKGSVENDGVKEVDCVITVTELIDLMSGREGGDEFDDSAAVVADLGDVPPSFRRGLLFGSSIDSENSFAPPGAREPLLLEELLCGLTPDGAQFSGGVL